jgi:hypothetical protein
MVDKKALAISLVVGFGALRVAVWTYHHPTSIGSDTSDNKRSPEFIAKATEAYDAIDRVTRVSGLVGRQIADLDAEKAIDAASNAAHTHGEIQALTLLREYRYAIYKVELYDKYESGEETRKMIEVMEKARKKAFAASH